MRLYGLTKFMKSSGFTLIEVLVALAVIAIALIAVVKVTSTDIQDATYLKDKTYGNIIALNAMANIQLGLTTLPVSNQPSVILGETLYWSGTETATPDPQVNEVELFVSTKPNSESVIHLQGFRQVKKET